MSTFAASALPPAAPVVYPESDGEPMAENTEQYDWIVRLKTNLDVVLSSAFVGGDLFWYPVEGAPEIRVAPDVLVALGRPKGPRGSYRTWDEGGVVPQVVFEIWSPGNTFPHRVKKVMFYDRHGVHEFYSYDPESREFNAWIRDEAGLNPVDVSEGWISPALGIRFYPEPGGLVVRGPDGRRFLTAEEIAREAEAERAKAARAQEEAVQAKEEAVQARSEAQRLRDRLIAAGINPDV